MEKPVKFTKKQTKCIDKAAKFIKNIALEVVNLNIQVNEHKNTDMFMFIIIYFTSVLEDNPIFLFRCLHCNLLHQEQ